MHHSQDLDHSACLFFVARMKYQRLGIHGKSHLSVSPIVLEAQRPHNTASVILRADVLDYHNMAHIPTMAAAQEGKVSSPGRRGPVSTLARAPLTQRLTTSHRDQTSVCECLEVELYPNQAFGKEGKVRH